MKRTLILCGLAIFAHGLFAQNTFPGTGNVGIGTLSPGAALDVNGGIKVNHGVFVPISSAGAAGLFIQGQTGVNANIIMEGNGTAQEFWITAAPNAFKIGAAGAGEPTTGAINVDGSGNVGINTLNTVGYKFAVAGSAVFTQAVVKLQANWPDYVFKNTYRLPSLESVASYIKTNHHLPGMPSAMEVAERGLDLGDTQARMLEKIEQLTLYTIELQKQADRSRAENEKLTNLLQAQHEKFASLQQQIDELKKSAR